MSSTSPTPCEPRRSPRASRPTPSTQGRSPTSCARPAARGLYRPARIARDRDLLRRVALTRMRSALKSRAGSVLAKQGIDRPYSDMFGPSGLRFLEALELPEARAGASTRRCG